MITHGRETYQPTSIMRWDRGILLLALFGVIEVQREKKHITQFRLEKPISPNLFENASITRFFPLDAHHAN
jgi:hypothetical protein